MKAIRVLCICEITVLLPPIGEGHARFLEKELPQRIRGLQSAEIGYRFRLLIGVEEQKFRPLEPDGLDLVEYRMSCCLAETLVDHPPRARKFSGDIGRGKAIACISANQIYRGYNQGISPLQAFRRETSFDLQVSKYALPRAAEAFAVMNDRN